MPVLKFGFNDAESNAAFLHGQLKVTDGKKLGW